MDDFINNHPHRVAGILVGTIFAILGGLSPVLEHYRRSPLPEDDISDFLSLVRFDKDRLAFNITSRPHDYMRARSHETVRYSMGKTYVNASAVSMNNIVCMPRHIASRYSLFSYSVLVHVILDIARKGFRFAESKRSMSTEEILWEAVVTDFSSNWVFILTVLMVLAVLVVGTIKILNSTKQLISFLFDTLFDFFLGHFFEGTNHDRSDGGQDFDGSQDSDDENDDDESGNDDPPADGSEQGPRSTQANQSNDDTSSDAMISRLLSQEKKLKSRLKSGKLELAELNAALDVEKQNSIDLAKRLEAGVEESADLKMQLSHGLEQRLDLESQLKERTIELRKLELQYKERCDEHSSQIEAQKGQYASLQARATTERERHDSIQGKLNKEISRLTLVNQKKDSNLDQLNTLRSTLEIEKAQIREREQILRANEARQGDEHLQLHSREGNLATLRKSLENQELDMKVREDAIIAKENEAREIVATADQITQMHRYTEKGLDERTRSLAEKEEFLHIRENDIAEEEEFRTLQYKELQDEKRQLLEENSNLLASQKAIESTHIPATSHSTQDVSTQTEPPMHPPPSTNTENYTHPSNNIFGQVSWKAESASLESKSAPERSSTLLSPTTTRSHIAGNVDQLDSSFTASRTAESEPSIPRTLPIDLSVTTSPTQTKVAISDVRIADGINQQPESQLPRNNVELSFEEPADVDPEPHNAIIDIERPSDRSYVARITEVHAESLTGQVMSADIPIPSIEVDETSQPLASPEEQRVYDQHLGNPSDGLLQASSPGDRSRSYHPPLEEVSRTIDSRGLSPTRNLERSFGPEDTSSSFMQHVPEWQMAQMNAEPVPQFASHGLSDGQSQLADQSQATLYASVSQFNPGSSAIGFQQANPSFPTLGQPQPQQFHLGPSMNDPQYAGQGLVVPEQLYLQQGFHNEVPNFGMNVFTNPAQVFETNTVAEEPENPPEDMEWEPERLPDNSRPILHNNEPEEMQWQPEATTEIVYPHPISSNELAQNTTYSETRHQTADQLHYQSGWDSAFSQEPIPFSHVSELVDSFPLERSQGQDDAQYQASSLDTPAKGVALGNIGTQPLAHPQSLSSTQEMIQDSVMSSSAPAAPQNPPSTSEPALPDYESDVEIPPPELNDSPLPPHFAPQLLRRFETATSRVRSHLDTVKRHRRCNGDMHMELVKELDSIMNEFIKYVDYGQDMKDIDMMVEKNMDLMDELGSCNSLPVQEDDLPDFRGDDDDDDDDDDDEDDIRRVMFRKRNPHSTSGPQSTKPATSHETQQPSSSSATFTQHPNRQYLDYEDGQPPRGRRATALSIERGSTTKNDSQWPTTTSTPSHLPKESSSSPKSDVTMADSHWAANAPTSSHPSRTSSSDERRNSWKSDKRWERNASAHSGTPQDHVPQERVESPTRSRSKGKAPARSGLLPDHSPHEQLSAPRHDDETASDNPKSSEPLFWSGSGMPPHPSAQVVDQLQYDEPSGPSTSREFTNAPKEQSSRRRNSRFSHVFRPY